MLHNRLAVLTIRLTSVLWNDKKKGERTPMKISSLFQILILGPAVLILLGCGERTPERIEIQGAIRPTPTTVSAASTQPAKRTAAQGEKREITLEKIAPIQIERSNATGAEVNAVAYDCQGDRISRVSFSVASGTLKLQGGDSVRYFAPKDLAIKADTITVAVWDEDGHHLEKEIRVTILDTRRPVRKATSRPRSSKTTAQPPPTVSSKPHLPSKSMPSAKAASVSKNEPDKPADATVPKTVRSTTLTTPPVSQSTPPLPATLKIDFPAEDARVGRIALVSGTAPASLEGTTLQFYVLADDGNIFPQGQTNIRRGRFENRVYIGRPGSIDVGKVYQVWAVAADGSRSNIMTLVRK
jgi:hypothetical protein